MDSRQLAMLEVRIVADIDLATFYNRVQAARAEGWQSLTTRSLIAANGETVYLQALTRFVPYPTANHLAALAKGEDMMEES